MVLQEFTLWFRCLKDESYRNLFAITDRWPLARLMLYSSHRWKEVTYLKVDDEPAECRSTRSQPTLYNIDPQGIVRQGPWSTTQLPFLLHRMTHLQERDLR